MDEQSLFERGPVVVFQWKNAPGWPVERVSSNVQEVLGYSAQSFLEGSISYASIIAPEDLERVGREVAKASSNGCDTFDHQPYRVRHENGQIRWLFDHTQVQRNEQGEAVHFWGYIFDITSWVEAQNQKQELERRLLHSQKLESLGLLAGGVAHDFNNLIGGVLGQASLLHRILSSADPDANQKVLQGLELIEQLSRHAAELTQQLLTYAGKGKHPHETLNLNKLTEGMNDIFRVAFSGKDPPQITLDPHLPNIEGDRSQLQQVIMNLVINAAESLGNAPGSVYISTRTLMSRTAGSLPQVQLEVRDTGCGMNQEVRERLFDPFFTTKSNGHGLGMSAVLGIVRHHQGTITVESEPGMGTRFLLTLPSSERSIPMKNKTISSIPLRNRGTILLVDDQAILRKAVGMMLKHLGFNTLEASHGEEALRLLSQHQNQISLLLVDVTMPGLSGYEIAQRVRKIYPTMPIILSSGYDESAESKERYPSTLFLAKPYHLDELERTIHTALHEYPIQ